MDIRVAVIGLGVSGIVQLRSFRELEKKGFAIPKIVCFEKQDTSGGLWNRTWKTGVDSNGENIHSGMYNHLFSNGPKECIEFPEYSFENHFGFPLPSYPPYEIIKSYLDGYFNKSDISDWVRFNTVVRNVRYSVKKLKFKVKYHDFISNRTCDEYFDYVIVATGHFSTPNIPNFKGIETFPGRILHSHDFREAREFQGKDVVVIGSGYSAEDIGSQCLKYGANSIVLSYRSQPTVLNGIEKWSEFKLLDEVKGNLFHFSDGNQCSADAIILCTGYVHNFPFLEDQLRLKTENSFWIDNLYNGVVWQDNPKLFFIGMQNQFFTFPLFTAQAWYARDIIMNKISLPKNKQEMQNEDTKWSERYNNLQSNEDRIQFQGLYIKHLTELTDYSLLDMDGVISTLIEANGIKCSNPLLYRGYSHRSLITGTMAPSPKRTWFDYKDYTLEEFLNDYRI